MRKQKNTHMQIKTLVAVACLAVCRAAVAAPSNSDADIDKLMPMSLMELIQIPIVTASRQAQTRDQTPAHIVVVTAQQIRERRYKNLADLLEDMPGVDFQRGTKSSQFNQFAIQGYMGPNKLVVMLDGMRISNPAGGNFPLADNLSLYMAKQVEFLYGPAAALYGADAVAGVINIITDHAADQNGSWVSGGGGNFGSREASFMTGMKTETGLALTVGSHWQQSDRAPLQDYFPKEFAKKDAKTFAGALVIPAAQREDYQGGIGSQSLFARMDLGRDLTLGFYRNVFRSLTSTGDTPVTARYLEDSQWITQSDTAYGKFRFDINPDLSGEFSLDYSRTEVDPRAKYNNIYNSFINGYSYAFGERQALEQNFNWRINDAHQMQFGLGYQRYNAIEASSLPTPFDTSKGADAQGYAYPNTTLPFAINDASFNNFSSYAQIQSQWSDQFSSVAGVRIDRHSNYGQSVNPRLGGVWRANEQHLFKALYGEAFRAPSPEESLSAFGTFDGSKTDNGLYKGTSFRIANFSLEPEKAKTLSLTWDWRPRQDLNIVSNLYRSQIENLIVTQASAAVNAIAGALLISPETKGNAGRQTQTGLDLTAQWRFKLSSEWSGDLWGSASWVSGQIDEGSGVDWDIPYVAAQKYKLGATLRYLDRVTITPQVLSTTDTTNGRKATVAPDRLETPGYTVANLHIGWHRLFGGKTTLWLDVYNLFDVRYSAAHGSASRTFFDMPQQPRSWMASVNYPF